MTLGRDIFFDVAGLQGAMFFTDRLGRFFNLPHNLLTLAYIFVIITRAMKLHYDLFLHFFIHFLNVICCSFCRLCCSYCRSLLFMSFVMPSFAVHIVVRIAVFYHFLIVCLPFFSVIFQ